MAESGRRMFTGVVLTLRCDSCGAVFPHFSFSGDEDTDTMGLCSASSCRSNQVVVFEAESAQWDKLDAGGAEEIERKLQADLARVDLAVPRLLRVERDQPTAGMVGFREFRKSYRQSVLIFSCACCGRGESRPISELSVEEFRRSGGTIGTLGRLIFSAN